VPLRRQLAEAAEAVRALNPVVELLRWYRLDTGERAVVWLAGIRGEPDGR
jgi:hypothetical protein